MNSIGFFLSVVIVCAGLARPIHGLSCYTCEVGLNGATECPQTPGVSEQTVCNITQTSCERTHDGSGAVTKRGCAELCVSMADTLSSEMLVNLVNYFLGFGTGCCDTDLCNGGLATRGGLIFCMAAVVLTRVFGE